MRKIVILSVLWLMISQGVAGSDCRPTIWVEDETGSAAVDSVSFYVEILDFFGEPTQQDSIMWESFELTFDSEVSAATLRVPCDQHMRAFDVGRYVRVAWSEMPHVWSYMCYIKARFYTRSESCGLKQHDVQTQRSLSYVDRSGSNVDEVCWSAEQPIAVSRDGFLVVSLQDAAKIEVYSAAGMLIYRNNDAADGQRIDMSRWPHGVYCVVGERKDGSVVSQKLLY